MNSKHMMTMACAVAMFAAIVSAAEPLKNGTRFAMKDVPEELIVERRAGEPARIEFAYRRAWEKGVKPIRTLKLILNTSSITNNVDSICRRGESNEK